MKSDKQQIKYQMDKKFTEGLILFLKVPATKPSPSLSKPAQIPIFRLSEIRINSIVSYLHSYVFLVVSSLQDILFKLCIDFSFPQCLVSFS